MNSFIEDYEKICPNCSEAFTAKRLNQEYCSSHCRVQFNNHKTKADRETINQITQEVNTILLSNRNILQRHFGKNPQVLIEVLVNEGFKRNFVTNFDKPANSENRYFCYDLGYTYLSNQTINIFKK